MTMATTNLTLVIKNAMENQITTPSYTLDSSTFVVSFIVIILVIVLSVSGNLINLHIFYQSPLLHDFHNLLAANLAFINLLIGLIVLPIRLVIISQARIDYGLCQFQAFCIILLYTASLAVTAVIAIDRCMAITKPSGYPTTFNWKKLFIITISTWILPLFLAIMPLLHLQRYGLGIYVPRSICVIYLGDNRNNRIIGGMILLFCILSVAIDIVCYSIIFTVASRKNSSMHNADISHSLMKSITTTALLIGTTLLCWLPVTIAMAIDYFQGFFQTDLTELLPPIVLVITMLLAIGNAAVNPIINLCSNHILRAKFRQIFSRYYCKTCCRRHRPIIPLVLINA